MFMIPLIDRVQYVHSLKVVPMEIPNQIAITQDNVTIDMDGVLYFQVLDPIKASYNIDDIDFAISQMALSTMRAEIGKVAIPSLPMRSSNHIGVSTDLLDLSYLCVVCA